MYPDLSPFFGTTIADSTPIKATLLDYLSVALPHHQKSIGIIIRGTMDGRTFQTPE